MAVVESGSNSAGKANVNADFELNVALTPTEAKAGFATITSENDGGTVTGSRFMSSP